MWCVPVRSGAHCLNKLQECTPHALQDGSKVAREKCFSGIKTPTAFDLHSLLMCLLCGGNNYACIYIHYLKGVDGKTAAPISYIYIPPTFFLSLFPLSHTQATPPFLLSSLSLSLHFFHLSLSPSLNFSSLSNSLSVLYTAVANSSEASPLWCWYWGNLPGQCGL